MMHSAYITFQSSQIHYSYSGNGAEVLLCLHGYGESEQSFHFLEKQLETEYCLIAIDLPYHGKTIWKEPLPVTIDDLLTIIKTICDERKIAMNAVNLLAFSMGGRVALNLLQRIPAQVKKVTLLAPDGMKVNFWYWLATQTYIGIKLFRFTMNHPYWFLLLLKLGNQIRVINPSIYKFIRYYIHDKTVRQELYDRWTCMRKIKPDLSIVKNNIRQQKIPVRLLYGRYDRIIRFERAEKFRNGIESFCTLRVIPSGHQLLQEKHAGLVMELVQS